MNYRKILLRTVFWALGLAAGFGAAGVIFAGHDTLWRIVGTCAVTAVGALLLLGASQLLEAEGSWLAGFMAVSLIVVEYIVGLGLVWELFKSAQGRVGMTLFCLGATGMPAIGFARVMRKPEAAVLARFGLVASAVVFLLFMLGTWQRMSGPFGEETWRWDRVAVSLSAFSILAVISLVGAGTDRRHWRWLGVAAAAGAFAISAYAILNNLHETSALFISIVSVAAVVAHANVILWCPLKPAHRWLIRATIGAGMMTGALVDLGSITRPWQEELLGRMAGAAAIITGCGTLALLVLTRVQRRGPPEVAWTRAQVSEIALICPRCAAKQTLSLGMSHCTKCGLLIELHVHETEPELLKTGLET